MDSGNMSSSENNQPGVEDYIKFQELLKQRCKMLKGVKEVSKLERKINAEMKFLLSLQAQDEVTQKSHLKSSNLSHFSSLVHAAELIPGVVQVLQPFDTPTRSDNLVVDIVAAGGHAWVKVIARKAQALHLVWAGQGQFGERDLVSQAEEYLECAARHPFEFTVPQIHFAFYNYVTQPMADCLKKIGVFVWGKVVPVETNVLAKLELLGDDDWQCGNVSDDCHKEKINIHDEQSKEELLSDDSKQAGSGTDESDHDTWNILNAQVKLELLLKDGDKSSNEREQLQFKETTSKVVMKNSQKCVEFSYKEPSFLGISHSNCSSAHSGSNIVKNCETFHTDRDVFSRSFQASPSIDEWHIPQKSFGFSHSDLQLDTLFQHLVASPPDYGQLLTADRSASSITRVNLDITALIALVSSVTNGNCHFVFCDKVLNLQAQEERESPVLPVLEKYLRGKEVFVCEAAVSSFQSILDILGGQSERRRASKLLARVRVVKDEPSQRALALACQGRIKERSKVIFGTGDSLQAVTMTSNMGFVRAAKSQGVVFSVFLHQARALTEEKELRAVPLTDELSTAAL